MFVTVYVCVERFNASFVGGFCTQSSVYDHIQLVQAVYVTTSACDLLLPTKRKEVHTIKRSPL